MELAIGEPENPASQEDFSKKFYTNATLLISESKAKKLEDAVLNLENISLAEFAKYLDA